MPSVSGVTRSVNKRLCVSVRLKLCGRAFKEEVSKESLEFLFMGIVGTCSAKVTVSVISAEIFGKGPGEAFNDECLALVVNGEYFFVLVLSDVHQVQNSTKLAY